MAARRVGDQRVDVHAEFLAGPTIRAAISTWSPGEDGETVLARARDALRRDRV